MAIRLSPRLRVMQALRRARHRYDLIRALSMSISLAILVVVPLSGLARVDFWGGDHRLLFERVPFKHGLAGVIVGIAAMYVVTFLSNVAAGRMFCGWGCPVGQISRFGETVETAVLRGKAVVRRHLEGAAFSALFVLALFAWWVDLRVLWQGSPRALAVSWGLVGVGVVASYAHARWYRWGFCKQLCPIGLYYSFMSPARWYGIHFRNQQQTCIECDACDNVCPVELTQRDLLKPMPARGGLSVTNAPGRNHCLECGDCVRACELMVGKRGLSPVPLKLGYFGGEQRLEAEQPESDAKVSVA